MWKANNFSATQIFNCQKGYFWTTRFDKIDFMENLRGRKILEFSHCVFLSVWSRTTFADMFVFFICCLPPVNFLYGANNLPFCSELSTYQCYQLTVWKLRGFSIFRKKICEINAIDCANYLFVLLCTVFTKYFSNQNISEATKSLISRKI